MKKTGFALILCFALILSTGVYAVPQCVGIGTQNPANTLHLFKTENEGRGINIDAQGTLSNQQAALNLITLGDGTKSLGNINTKGWHLAARGNAFNAPAEQNDLILTYADGTVFTPRMYWDNTGNVGIGKDPLEKLDVAGTVKATRFMLSDGTVLGTGGTTTTAIPENLQVKSIIANSVTANGVAASDLRVTRHIDSNYALLGNADDGLYLNHFSNKPVVLASGGGEVFVGTSPSGYAETGAYGIYNMLPSKLNVAGGIAAIRLQLRGEIANPGLVGPASWFKLKDSDCDQDQERGTVRFVKNNVADRLCWCVKQSSEYYWTCM